MKIKRFKGDWLLYIILGSIISVFCILALANVFDLRVTISTMILIVLGIILLLYVVFTTSYKIFIQKEGEELTVLKFIEVALLLIVSIMALTAESLGIEDTFPKALCIALPIATYAFIDVIRGYGVKGKRTTKQEVMKYVSIFLLIVGIVLITISGSINDQITNLFLTVLLIIGVLVIIAGILLKMKKMNSINITTDKPKQSQNKPKTNQTRKA